MIIEKDEEKTGKTERGIGLFPDEYLQELKSELNLSHFK